MRGRKPHPTHLKLVKGDPGRGRRPINKNEAHPERALPKPPAHLQDEAKVEWGRVVDELYNLGLLTNLDRAALGAYCQAYARWATAEEALARMAAKDPVTQGLLIQTKQGNAIQNPLVGAANKAAADMVRYAAEFGMTPSARSRISAEKRQEEADPAAAYF